MHKIAVVTGSSRGIGKVIKSYLESEGNTVIGLCRNPEDEKYEKKCDIRKESDIQRCIKEIILEYGEINILVNNAGIVTTGSFESTNLESWSNVISTNLTGPFLLCKYILPHMKKKKAGKVINVSSIAARNFSISASTEYTASKYGLIGLTKQLAYEYGQYNININCICPSQTKTEMLEKNLSKDQISNIEKNIPLKKIATTDQIANIVIFLCSEKSNYMQGAIVDVNGGQI